MQISSDLSVSSMVYETQGKESTELILCFSWYHRYLLPDHVGTCHLRISFSAHNDLNVKFQSHRSRDYTNPYLPVAPSAIDGSGQFGIGPDGKRREPESNVLLVSIENMQYAVTIDVLHTVSRCRSCFHS
jgi:hypothetical protein